MTYNNVYVHEGFTPLLFPPIPPPPPRPRWRLPDPNGAGCPSLQGPCSGGPPQALTVRAAPGPPLATGHPGHSGSGLLGPPCHTRLGRLGYLRVPATLVTRDLRSAIKFGYLGQDESSNSNPV